MAQVLPLNFINQGKRDVEFSTILNGEEYIFRVRWCEDYFNSEDNCYYMNVTTPSGTLINNVPLSTGTNIFYKYNYIIHGALVVLVFDNTKYIEDMQIIPQPSISLYETNFKVYFIPEDEYTNYPNLQV